MTYYLYKTELGLPDLTDYKLPAKMFPSHKLVETGEGAPPVVSGMRFDENDNLIPVGEHMPTWQVQRIKAYPSYGDQFDMLWHAMDDGTIPKVEPFYTEIKAVKEQFPKPE